MHVGVDTSGRIDEFGEPTAIGFSNRVDGAVLLSGSLKLEATSLLRKQGKSRAFCKMRLFVIALYLLLRPHIEKIDLITIDRDFKGWEGEIKDMLFTYLRREKPDFNPDYVRFDSLAGHRCHTVANGAFRGDFPCGKLGAKEFLALIPTRKRKTG